MAITLGTDNPSLSSRRLGATTGKPEAGIVSVQAHDTKLLNTLAY